MIISSSTDSLALLLLLKINIIHKRMPPKRQSPYSQKYSLNEHIPVRRPVSSHRNKVQLKL